MRIGVTISTCTIGWPPLGAAPSGGIEFVGFAGVSHAGATSGTKTLGLTSLTGGIDTAPRDGDVIYAFCSHAAGYNPPSTAGYTAITDRVHRKRMGATPDTVISVPASGNGQYAQVIVAMVFRGVHASTPEDVAAVESATIDPAAVTPVTAGAVVLVFERGANTSGGVSSFTSSDLSPFYSQDSVDTRSISCGTGIKTGWVSGPFDPGAFTDVSGVYTFFGGVTIALRPA